jgi:hypothetical protein
MSNWQAHSASPVFSALNRDFRYIYVYIRTYMDAFRKSIRDCNFTDVNGAHMPNSLTTARATKKSTEIAGVENKDLAC